MTLLIRRAAPAEAPILADIERESFGKPHWTIDDFRRYDCLVGEIEKRIAGFLVSRQTAPALIALPAEREILNVAVLPAYRRLGIASALLKEELRRNAVFFLEVRESNVAAQELYRRFQFAEIGRRPNYYQFPLETAIVMRLERR